MDRTRHMHFRCGVCGDTVGAMDPDPGLWGDMIVAHGESHGKDWRDQEQAVMAAWEEDLLEQLREAERRGML